jgi:Mg-chelatase subunit ChlD
MNQSLNPRTIPPPLPSRKQTPPRNPTDHEEALFDTRTRNAMIGFLVGLAILMLLLALFLIVSGAGGGNGDKLGSGDTKGPVEGILAGENESGDSLENGQDDKTRVKAGESEVDQTVDPGAEVAAEKTPAPVPQDNSQASDDSASSGNDDGDVKEQTVVMSRVPNRQAKAGNGTPANQAGKSAGLAGSDLKSSKGMNPFVGEGKPAASTVYVIDVSGSMQRPDRLPRVMNALSKAIDQLKDNQKVCVFLFDNFYFSDPLLPGLVPATKKNQERIKAWLAIPQGGGGTQPMAAMAEAIALNPERIVLLSDGEFDPTNVQTITMLNKRNTKPARIDCVGLMEQVIVLQEIAKANQGIYYQAY